MIFFPAVGLLIGLAVAAVDYGLSYILPPAVRSVLAVCMLLWISGGLHVDGLADTADGIFSSRSKEKILEIMKDSRSGPMAVAAVSVTLLLKASVLYSLPEEMRCAALVLTPLAGRCALVIVMGLYPYLRTGGGTGTPFQEGCTGLNALWSAVFLLAAGWFVASLDGMVSGALSLVAALLAASFIYRKIKGYTGDTLGAVCEVTEVMPALSLVAINFTG